MQRTWNRLGAWALLIGVAVAGVGYLATAVLVTGGQRQQLLDPLWIPLNSVALAGDLLAILGLAVAIGAALGARFLMLTVVGTIGTSAALTMLNLSEGVVQTYVEPYLAVHGGVPADPPAGWDVFENVALLLMLVGLVCLGLSVILGRRVPWPAGAALIVSPLLALVGLPMPFALASDGFAYAGLIVIALHVIRGRADQDATSVATSGGRARREHLPA